MTIAGFRCRDNRIHRTPVLAPKSSTASEGDVMSGPHRGFVVALLAAVVLTAGPRAQEAPEPGRGHPAADWPFAGGDWTGSRHSTLADVSTGTIDRLGGAWVARLPGGVSSRATPVADDGVLYLTGGANVFAIDGRTGETVWRWQAGGSGAEAQRVPSWQGVGLGGGLVFVGLRSAEVAALRQDTGEPVWVEPVGSVPAQAGETVTTAPMHARGRVFVGLANGDSGGQGRVIALDAATGEKLWTFFVVPRPGEFGHETWPQDSDVWRLGGGGVWLVGAADPDLGLVYFVTGNPVPMYGGEIRAGDNLFTASVLALDMETGERRWHYQVVRHDVWDADVATPLLLYETVIEGAPARRWRRCGPTGTCSGSTGRRASRSRRSRNGRCRRMRSCAPRRRSRSRPAKASCRRAPSGATGFRRRSSSVAARTPRRRSTGTTWWPPARRFRWCG